MNETATMEFSEETKKRGDEIAGLNLKEAKELSDYLKDEHGIEAAAGGAVMMAPASDGPAAAALILPPRRRPPPPPPTRVDRSVVVAIVQA